MPIKNITKLFILVFLIAIYHPVFSGQKIPVKLRKSGISNRDLLGLGPPAVRALNLFQSQSSQRLAPDTLRIVAIRVEFKEDDDSFTTGNGKFALSSSSELLIDGPPHDLTYFEHQLTALANYFKTVSRGKLVLEAEVFPKDSEASYTVSHTMSYYSPFDSEELLDQRLSELFQESFQAADTTDNIDFSRFDSFIIFHAGVGADFAFDFDQTPQDIPSVFLDYATLQKYLGNSDPAYPGISVNNNKVVIRDGVILPETQSQNDFEIALLGTMAIMFGHQLGLPNLFNTDTGRPGIGIFGLMDQGSGNFMGLLPAEPCAWSKLYLGWETANERKNGDSLQVAAPQAANPNKIYKIPINAKEYFLVENRFRDINGDELAIGQDANGNRVEFKSDASGQRILAQGQIGVITQVNEYDFGLPVLLDSLNQIIPGPGILIWHIDERVIEANFASNRVNADPEHRGVDLEEADGAQDIGQIYDFLSAGGGSESGSPLDAWWASHPVITRFLRPGEPVTFNPSTSPSSNSNDGSNSHIEITNFSEPGPDMTFSVREDISHPGFPQFVGDFGNIHNSPIVADLDLKGDGMKEVIWSDNRGTKIFVWKSDGSKFIQNEDTAQIQKLNGVTITLPLAVFAEPRGTLSFTPAIASFDDQNVVVAVTDEVIAVYLPEDTDLNGRADSLFVFQFSEKFTTPPMVINSGVGVGQFQIIAGTQNGNIIAIDGNGAEWLLTNVSTSSVAGLAFLPSEKIAFTTEDGKVGLLSLDGSLIWQNSTNYTFSKAPVIGDINRDDELNIIAISDNGKFFVYEPNGDESTGFPKPANINLSSQIALGDLDGDIFLEMVFIAENQIYAFNHAGYLINQFPIQISQNKNGDDIRIKSSPVLADINDDGLPEVLVGSGENQLVAFQSDGQKVAGFPLSTGQAVNSTPAIADIDNDGDIEVTVVSEDGFIYIWDLPGNYKPDNIPWGDFLHDVHHTNANLELISPRPPVEQQLMPSNLVYNYPNPTEGLQTTIRYRLNYGADVRIKIYDLAGDLVDEFTGPGFGQIDNEVDWRLDRIESGVYLARVEAEGNGIKDVVVFKIAVVK